MLPFALVFVDLLRFLFFLPELHRFIGYVGVVGHVRKILGPEITKLLNEAIHFCKNVGKFADLNIMHAD